MNLLSAKKNIKSELAGLYPTEEIQAITRTILEKYTGFTATEIITKENFEIDFSTERQISKVLQRLKQKEPLQYILGETEFYGLKFTVNPSVLIPRNETEELVDWIIKDNTLKDPAILDIGSGSGCIAISLKKNIPDAKVTALDISKEALKTARANAILNKTEIEFIEKDILNPDSTLKTKCNIIASNPPYVRDYEKLKMDANVVEHEPHLALFVKDEDPLIFYRAIAAFAKTSLHPGGILFLEINEALADETASLFTENSFTEVIIRKDIHGKNRMIKAVLKPV